MDILTAILGSEAKVKLLRLFLFNQGTAFFLDEIVERSKCASALVRKELAPLVAADIIKKREITKDIPVVRGKITTIKKKKGQAYILNDKFPYLEPLKNFLTVASLHADESLTKRFGNVGRIKLFVVAGIFMQNWDSRVDMLLVGDDLNLVKIESVIKNIESEIGREIAYSAFDVQDFEYRVGIHDRLVRDILDYPHITLLDRMGIEQAQ
jgi:hypothetical protein